MSYQKVTKEGIYYIKNKKTNKYLDADNKGNVIQHSLENAQNAKWLIKKNGNDFKVLNVNCDKLLTVGTDNNAVLNDNTNISFLVNQFSIDNTNFRVNTSGSSYNYYLGIKDNGLAEGTQIVFSNNSGSNGWYLEKVNYKLGDMNMDGQIDDSDEDILYKIVKGYTNGTNIEKYLGDIDGNGIVNESDYVMLLNIINE